MKSSKLCNALGKRIESYISKAKKARKDTTPDTIHDFRVASRFLLAVEPLLASVTHTHKWRKKVKRQLKLFTHLRDLHVFHERFRDHAQLGPMLEKEIEAELEKLDSQRKLLGTKEIRKTLRATYQRFCLACHNKKTANALVRELWLNHYENMQQRLQDIDYEQPETIHKLRISFKPFRYFAMFLHESDLVPITSFDDFKYWQDLMGEFNDLKVVTDWLLELGHHEELVRQLIEDAELLRLRLQAEEPAFRAFAADIHREVLERVPDPDTSA